MHVTIKMISSWTAAVLLLAAQQLPRVDAQQQNLRTGDFMTSSSFQHRNIQSCPTSGQQCFPGGQCDTGLVCHDDKDWTYGEICLPEIRKKGQRCATIDGDAQCEDGHYCNWKCVALPGVGEQCGSQGQCASGLVCHDDADVVWGDLCLHPIRKAGERCRTTQYGDAPCENGYYCDWTCLKLPGPSEICAWGDKCAAGLVCHSDKDWLRSKQCFHRIRKVGERCAAPDGDVACESGARCNWECVWDRRAARELQGCIASPTPAPKEPPRTLAPTQPKPTENPAIVQTPTPTVIVPKEGNSTLTPEAFKSCLNETDSLLKACHESYDATGAATTVLRSTSRKSVVIDDFSINAANNEAYKNICLANGGNYVEINYEAMCSSSENEMVQVFVSGQPRCYSITCAGAADEELLQEFALRLTEERADLQQSSSTNHERWACKGKLVPTASTACEKETDILAMETKIKLPNIDDDIVPEVKQKKVMFIFNKDEHLVSFPQDNNAAVAAACEDSGGDFTKLNTMMMNCGDADGASGDEKLLLEIEGFSTCLGASCTQYYSIGMQKAPIEFQIKAKLMKTEILGDNKENMVCKFVSSGSAIGVSVTTMTIGVLAAALAVFV